MSKKFQELLAGASRIPHQSMASFALVMVSLVIMLMAFQVNFDQNALYTQVVFTDDRGIESVMSFREYRLQESQFLYERYSECLQINELFGDGTGEECEVLEEQYWCMKDSGSQQELSSCV